MWNIFQYFYQLYTVSAPTPNTLQEPYKVELELLKNKVNKLEMKIEEIEQDYTDYINELYDLYNSLH